MARYVILKKTRQQVVVKVLGTGEVTIPFTDFALADETLVAPTSNVNFIYWNSPAVAGNIIELKRGGTVTQYLSGGDNWNLSQGTGFSDDELNDQPLGVNIIGDNSTIIICLTKGGYKEPNTQGTGR